MKAIVIRAYGGPEELRFEERPDPIAGPGDLLVRVGAMSVNPFDISLRAGPTFALSDNAFANPCRPMPSLCVVNAADLANVPNRMDIIDDGALPTVMMTGAQLAELAAHGRQRGTALVTGLLATSGVLGYLRPNRAAGSSLPGCKKSKHWKRERLSHEPLLTDRCGSQALDCCRHRFKEDLRMKSIGFVVLFMLLNLTSWAETQTPDSIPLESMQLTSSETLNKFVPVLPEVKQHFWKLDPNTGYAVHSVGGGVYVISDNGWQSAWLVTDDGVIVFDAPASFGKSIPSEIAKVTNKPIKILVYSHIHKDHIGGSWAFKNVPGLKIVATEPVANFLKEQNDPDRPIPNVTFGAEKTLTLGGKTVQLMRHFYHSNTGDLFIYVPSAKFMMAIDCVTPGYAPFQGFDITENFGEYLKVFDQLLAYDFDTFVGGHLTDIGSKQDVEITKEFTYDVYDTVKRIHNNLDQPIVVAQAANYSGPENEFLLFKVVLDKVAYDSVAELQPRWINRLAGVDVWLESHVRTAILYVRWDDKAGGDQTAKPERGSKTVAHP